MRCASTSLSGKLFMVHLSAFGGIILLGTNSTGVKTEMEARSDDFKQLNSRWISLAATSAQIFIHANYRSGYSDFRRFLASRCCITILKVIIVKCCSSGRFHSSQDGNLYGSVSNTLLILFRRLEMGNYSDSRHRTGAVHRQPLCFSKMSRGLAVGTDFFYARKQNCSVVDRWWMSVLVCSTEARGPQWKLLACMYATRKILVASVYRSFDIVDHSFFKSFTSEEDSR